MKFHVLTLFPEMITRGLNTSITGRAIAQGYISLNAVNIREYTEEKHGKVDDYPYGGGAGMLMQAQPVYDAYRAVTGARKLRTVYVTPQGTTFSQKMAEELAREEELVFLCGHYEGIDERVLEEIVTDYVSIGDYVLTGGELPAMVMIDAVSRLVPGVLNNEVSAETESFHNDLLEYPQYSRPEVWHDKPVPKVLLSGNHRNIRKWRLEQSEERTAQRRPDLYEKYREKQNLIRELSARKREHIHMMELLDLGNGEIVFRKGKNVILYDRKAQGYLLTGEESGKEKLMEALLHDRKKAERKCGYILSTLRYLPEELEDMGAVFAETVLVNGCYTRKEPLTVKYKEIRRINEQEMRLLSEQFPVNKETEEKLIAGGLCAVAECDGRIVGFAGLYPDQSMGILYVDPRWRLKGIGSSLESFLINRLLELGRVPFVQVPEDEGIMLLLQEKMGLYLSGGRLYRYIFETGNQMFEKG